MPAVWLASVIHIFSGLSRAVLRATPVDQPDPLCIPTKLRDSIRAGMLALERVEADGGNQSGHLAALNSLRAVAFPRQSIVLTGSKLIEEDIRRGDAVHWYQCEARLSCCKLKGTACACDSVPMDELRTCGRVSPDVVSKPSSPLKSTSS